MVDNRPASRNRWVTFRQKGREATAITLVVHELHNLRLSSPANIPSGITCDGAIGESGIRTGYIQLQK